MQEGPYIWRWLRQVTGEDSCFGENVLAVGPVAGIGSLPHLCSFDR